VFLPVTSLQVKNASEYGPHLWLTKVDVFMSPFFITVRKCVSLGTYKRQEIHLVHSYGGSNNDSGISSALLRTLVILLYHSA
jgi:hypothetical protein